MSARNWLYALGMLFIGGVNLATSDVAGEGQATATSPVIQIQQKAPKRVEQGQEIPLEIQLTNSGALPVRGLTVTYGLSADFDLLDCSPPPRRDKETLSWNLAGLGPKETTVLRLRLAVKPGAAQPVLQSTATAAYQACVSSKCPVEVKQPALELVVTGPETGVVGESLPLQLAIINHSSTTIHRVSLACLLPAGLHHSLGRELENEIGDLEAGKNHMIPLVVTPLAAGEIRSRMRVWADGVQAAECQVRMHVVEARLELTASGPKQSHLQDFCTYEFTIHNHSRHKAHTVCLEVRLPRGLAFLEASGHGLYDSTSHLVRWDMASFAPAESQTVAIKGRAKETGAQQGKVILKLGAGDQRETTWSTEVLPQSGPPAPRGEGTAKGGI